MKKNLIIVILLTSFIMILLALIVLSFFYNINDAIIKLSCSVLGVLLPIYIGKIQDLTDKMPWRTYLRFLLRKKQINKNTKIRISFSTFFKIRVDDTFLLIPNKYGINDFQIPGYTYQLSHEEKKYLIKNLEVSLDDRIVSKKIKNDYRLFVKASKISKFYKRFNEIYDYKKGDYILGYFNSLFIKNEYLPKDLFENVNYFFVKRDVKPIAYSSYFSCYELLLRDLYEIELNEMQLEYLRNIKNNNLENKDFYFATDDLIKTCGIDYKNNQLHTFISEHTKLLLDDENS